MKFLPFAFIALLASCASTNDAPVNFYDVSKLEVPPPQEAHIYFIRPSAFIAAFSAPKILLNGKKVGDLSNGTYFIKKVVPGKYQVFVDWGGGRGRNMEVNAPAGKRTYVETECQYTGMSGSITYYGCPVVSVSETRALRILPDLNLAK